MAMRMGRSRTPSKALAWLTGLTASALALVFASTTFTCGVAPNSVIEDVSAGIGRASAAPAVRPGVSTGEQARSSYAWEGACCAALLVASAFQVIRAKQPARSRARVVACRAAPVAYNSLPSASLAQEPIVLEQQPELAAASPLVLLASTEVFAVSEASAMQFVSGAVPAFSDHLKASSRRGRPARRAGSARCKSARRASSRSGFAAASASRRRAGSRLQAASMETLIVVAPSFDSSVIRTKLQLGLRHSSRVQSGSFREVQVPAGTLGSTRNTRVCRGGGFAAVVTDKRKLHHHSLDELPQ